MSFMRKVPVEVVDEMDRMESRVAFLCAACGAFSILNEEELDAMTGKKVWEGLFYWTQDLEDMLRWLNELANPE